MTVQVCDLVIIERQKYLCINEIIEEFKDIFKHKNYTESFLLEALNINSMNVENTYNYLKNPNGISKNKLIIYR